MKESLITSCKEIIKVEEFTTWEFVKSGGGAFTICNFFRTLTSTTTSAPRTVAFSDFFLILNFRSMTRFHAFSFLSYNFSFFFG